MSPIILKYLYASSRLTKVLKCTRPSKECLSLCTICSQSPEHRWKNAASVKLDNVLLLTGSRFRIVRLVATWEQVHVNVIRCLTREGNVGTSATWMVSARGREVGEVGWPYLASLRNAGRSCKKLKAGKMPKAEIKQNKRSDARTFFSNQGFVKGASWKPQQGRMGGTHTVVSFCGFYKHSQMSHSGKGRDANTQWNMPMQLKIRSCFHSWVANIDKVGCIREAT